MFGNTVENDIFKQVFKLTAQMIKTKRKTIESFNTV